LDTSGKVLENGVVESDKVIGQTLDAGVYFLIIENLQNKDVYKLVKL
jgi:hypothetical protein